MVMFYISIPTTVILHHVKSYEVTLLDGGEQIESWMDGVFFGLEKEEELLGQDLELNISRCDFFDDERFSLWGLFRWTTPV